MHGLFVRRRIVRWCVVAGSATVLYYAVVSFALASLLIGNNSRWRGMSAGPGDYRLASETVSLDATDGVPLRAWWIPARQPAQGSVVIAHGVDHNRQAMLPRAAFLVHAGYNVLTIDLRGHGESGGTVVSPGILEANDITGAVRFASSREADVPVAVLGVSYGAVAALFAAVHATDLAGVIVDGAFPSGGAVYRRTVSHYIHNGATPLWMRGACAAAAVPGLSRAISLAYRVRTGVNLGSDLGSAMSIAPRVRVPVLMISGTADWMVPLPDVQELRAALANTQTTLAAIPRAGHDTTYSTAPDIYESAVLTFLSGVAQTGRAH